MKTIGQIKMFVVACMVLTASAASAEDGKTYFGFNAGVFMPTDSEITDNVGDKADIEYDAGFTLGAFGGYEFGNGLRLEGELAYKQADMDKIKVGSLNGDIKSEASVFSVMANVFYDFKNKSIVTPYIGGGIGIATVYVDDASVNGTTVWNNDDDTVFAYQVGAGVGFNVSSRVTLDLGYRYFGTSDVKFEMAKAEFASHNVLGGVRFKF